MPEHQYHLRNIRKLLIEGFSTEELRFLCFENQQLRPIHNQLPEDGSKSKVVMIIMEISQQRELFDPLLSILYDENRGKYESLEPFYIYDQGQPQPPSLNPFIYYGGPVPPDNFIGHQQYAQFCQDILTRRQSAKISITGERRIGKTSLLHYLRYFGPEETWGQNRCLFIDCALLNLPVTFTTFWKFMLNTLEDALETKSLLQTEIAALQRQDTLSNEHLQNFLALYYNIYPEQTLTLLLDEFELLLKNYSQETTIVLNSLGKLEGINIITATRDDLSIVCQPHTAATQLQFYGNFMLCQLTSFDYEEMVKVIQTLLADNKIQFNSAELGYIWDLSQLEEEGAFPIFVQVASSLIFNQKRNQASIDYRYLEREFVRQTTLYRDLPASAKKNRPAPQQIEILDSDDETIPRPRRTPTPVKDPQPSHSAPPLKKPSEYDQTLKTLEEHLLRHHPNLLVDFYGVAQQLRKNLQNETQYGLTPALEQERRIIIEKLSALTKKVFGKDL